MQAYPRIYHATWTRKDGYQYQFGIHNAPWILHRLASDVPAPKHILDLVNAEQTKYQTQTIHMNGVSTQIVPFIDYFAAEDFSPDGGAPRFFVTLSWYLNGSGPPVGGAQYEITLPKGVVNAHLAHLEAVAAVITTPLLPTDAENNGYTYSPGHGPSKP